MRAWKNLLIPLLCLSAAAMATEKTAAPQPAVPDIRQSGFIYCVNGIVSTFNPQLVSSGVTVDTLAAQLYDRLLDVDPYTYRLIPELAQSWEVLDGGATYILHLRRDVPFQKTPWFTPTRNMNADDVLFSFERMFDAQHPYHDVNGGHYPYFDSLQFSNAVQSMRKLDNYTVEIRLKQPDASFLWHLATHYAPILSAQYADQLTQRGQQAQIDRLPVGTGPFIRGEYRAGQFIRLLRNPTYWKGTPRMKQVVIDLGAGGTGRISKLLTGECDVLAYPAASQLGILRNDPRLRLTLRPGMNVAYLAFNTRKPPLNNENVRRAIAYSINNQRLMQSIYYGTAETAASLLPRASWAYDNDARVTDYDPEKARAMLKAAGISNLRLQLWVPTASQAYNPSPLKTAELSCAAIQSQTNLAHWCDPAFDALLHRALQAQQLAQRIDDYQAAQKILEQQLPILPLASSLRLQAYRYDIKGLVLSPFGNASFAGVYREAAPAPTPPLTRPAPAVSAKETP